jgi:hypothetical protein
MDLQKLNDALIKGELPEELNFTNTSNTEVDISKLKYNAFYRDYEFYESKFPQGYQSIAGFDKIIQLIADVAEKEQVSPLKEILEKQKINENNNK